MSTKWKILPGPEAWAEFKEVVLAALNRSAPMARARRPADEHDVRWVGSPPGYPCMVASVMCGVANPQAFDYQPPPAPLPHDDRPAFALLAFVEADQARAFLSQVGHGGLLPAAGFAAIPYPLAQAGYPLPQAGQAVPPPLPHQAVVNAAGEEVARIGLDVLVGYLGALAEEMIAVGATRASRLRKRAYDLINRQGDRPKGPVAEIVGVRTDEEYEEKEEKA